MQDVLLGHDGNVFLQGLEVGEEVFAVHRHGAGVGRVLAAEDRQQGRLTRTAWAQQAHELAGPDHQADLVEQRQRPPGRPVLDHSLELARGQLDVVRPRPADQSLAVELERERPDVDAVAGPQLGWSAEPLAVEERAVCTPQVGEDHPAVLHGQTRVQPGDVRVVEQIPRGTGLAADHPAALEREPLALGRSAQQRHVPGVDLRGLAVTLGKGWCEWLVRVDRQDFHHRPRETELDPVAGADRCRPIHQGVVQESLVLSAEMDQREPLIRRLDLGMNPRDLGKGDRIDRELASGIPAEADDRSTRVAHGWLAASRIDSDPKVHRPLAPPLVRNYPRTVGTPFA